MAVEGMHFMAGAAQRAGQEGPERVAEDVTDRGAGHAEVGAGTQVPGPQHPVPAQGRAAPGRLGLVLVCLDGHPSPLRAGHGVTGSDGG